MLTVQKPKTGLNTSKSIQYALYTGAALIVTSMLFLGRDLAARSFFAQILTTITTPALFYGIGIWVYRKLNAPLAAPGIVTTGAWLIGVALVHFYNQRDPLPDGLQSIFWLVIAFSGAAIITVTGHRVRLWLIVPLIPLAQINALFAALELIHLPVEWLVPVSFLLVVIWWQTPLKDARMGAIYRVSGALFTAALLGFTAWLPRMTDSGFILSCIVGGLVLLRFGEHRQHRIATHSGLWLWASAWGKLYFVLQTDGSAFGLWLAMLAVTILLIERIIYGGRMKKSKSTPTLMETFINWMYADLVIGLSALVLLWSALHIDSVSVWIIAATLSIAVGIWITAGLIYRLPILIHVALWIAPFPYTLYCILAAPSIWRLPLLGLAWQVFGAALLTFGFVTRRYRPAVRTPFFVVGYVMSAIGLLTALSDPALTVFSLCIMIIISGISATAAMLNRFIVWERLVAAMVDPDKRPYAYAYIYHGFLMLTAWLAAIWVQLTLAYTDMALSRQGVFLLLFACAWLLVGKLLSDLDTTTKPGIPGVMVSSAGWLLWLTGLLQVFFSPTEALIALILGLVISGEAILRNRGAAHWLPIGLIQIGYTALQIAHMLEVPSEIRLALACLAAAAMVTVLCAKMHSRQLPKVALALIGASGCLFLLSSLRQPIGYAMTHWGVALAFVPLSIPLGVVVLASAHLRIHSAAYRRLLDFAGTFILIGGAAAGIERSNLICPASAITAVHLVALVGYGIIAGRRIPFVSAGLILLAGGAFCLFKINLWLIPLTGGVLLLAGALWVETRRQAAESLTQSLITRWNRWI